MKPIKITIYFTTLAILVFGLQLSLSYFYFYPMFNFVLKTNLFMLFTSILLFFSAIKIDHFSKNNTGFVYIGGNLLRIFAAVYFLWPIIKVKPANFSALVLIFMAIYFIFNILEIIYFKKLIEVLSVKKSTN
jgi:hypothetical protein